jgi:D-alanyl-D-alanine dipeptidase
MQAYRFFITLVLILDIYYSSAQNGPVNKYGVPVLFDKDEFFQIVEKDSSKAMTELKQMIPNIIYELRYASRKNFMKKRMYPRNTTYTFLRLPAARALQAVQLDLNTKGLGLKIWDAYRPYSVTVSFWELIKDERYVADPKKGSGHNRGIAVDLTLIDLASGKELDMGTGFDNFTDTAHHDFQNLSSLVLDNRQILKTAMEKHGFIPFSTEWWHYSLPNSTPFELLDIPFKTLKKKARTQR